MRGDLFGLFSFALKSGIVSFIIRTIRINTSFHKDVK